MPGLWKVNEKRPPGATVPESQVVSLAVEVWEIESVLVQMTVVPTVTSSMSGLKALVVNPAAPTGIDTDDDGAEGVGEDGDGVGDGVGVVGVGEVVDEEPLHAIEKSSSVDARDARNDVMTCSRETIVAMN